MTLQAVKGGWVNTKHRLPDFKIVTEAVVDGSNWYTVQVYRHDVQSWVREQNPDQWWEHPLNSLIGTMFDVHEELYTLAILRWP